MGSICRRGEKRERGQIERDELLEFNGIKSVNIKGTLISISNAGASSFFFISRRFIYILRPVQQPKALATLNLINYKR